MVEARPRVLVGEGRVSFRDVIHERAPRHREGYRKDSAHPGMGINAAHGKCRARFAECCGVDKERQADARYRYDGSVANRALELLGKQQGMFIDRHEVGQPNEFANWTNEELKAFIKSGTEALGIVSGKTQH